MSSVVDVHHLQGVKKVTTTTTTTTTTKTIGSLSPTYEAALLSKRSSSSGGDAGGSKVVRFVCGVDEAGRGPLAGPVVAAACYIPMDVELEGIQVKVNTTTQHTGFGREHSLKVTSSSSSSSSSLSRIASN